MDFFQPEVMLASIQNHDLDVQMSTSPNEESEATETASSVDDPGPSSLHDEKIIYSSDGVIVSGAPDALLSQMLPTATYAADKETIFTLLLNLRAFISPAELLHKVLQVCFRKVYLSSYCF